MTKHIHTWNGHDKNWKVKCSNCGIYYNDWIKEQNYGVIEMVNKLKVSWGITQVEQIKKINEIIDKLNEINKKTGD